MAKKVGETRKPEKLDYEALANLAAIVDGSDDAILSKTLEGKITSWNRGAEHIYGYKPKDIIGKNISILTPPGQKDVHKEIIQRIKRGEKINHFEIERIRKDGTVIQVSLSVSPVLDRNGVLKGASIIARDITDRKRVDELAKRTAELMDVLKQVKETVNVLTVSTSEILAATTQVASITSENAAAISETTTTVEEVRQAAQLSSNKAKNVSESAQRVAQIGQSGQTAVDETTAVMRQVRDQMEAIARTIIRLSEQSQSIGGIIATVTDIADQSNLLAVNAAIEAARAGEQGKGFAVVAQEIKSMAEQSKQATIQVRNILGDIQKATSAAVMATEQGSKAADAGVKQSAQAGESIVQLAQNITEAVQMSLQITASSQQQVVGMNQIGVAMANINQAGMETVASMKQAESAAKNLSELGEKLKSIADQFKL
jgi:PAS domain S-box-containing protein